MQNPYPNTIKAISSSTFTWRTLRTTYRIVVTRGITRTIHCKVIWTPGATLMRVTNQLSISTTRHTISNTFSSCNSKHVSNSIRTCSKPRAWPKCRIILMRITYLPSKSNSLTRCQVRERLVSTDKSMRIECPLLMMPELMHMSMLRMRTKLSIGNRMLFNRYILNT